MATTSEHLSDDSLERYRARKMAPDELLVSDDHLAGCDECYSRLQDEAATRAMSAAIDQAFQAPPARSGHLTYEQIAAYVDREGGQVAKNTDEHLAVCASCAMEMRELRSFKSTMGDLPSKPPATAGKTANIRAVFRRRTAFRIAIPVAAAAALLLLGWAVTLPFRSRIARLEAQVDQLEQTRDSLEKARAKAADLEAEIASLRSENQELTRAVEGVRIVASLNDGGGRIALDREGNISGLPSLSPVYEREVREAMNGQQLGVPADIARLRGRSGALMGPDNGRSYGLLSPVGLAVETDRPTLRWNPTDGAATYVASVYTDDLKLVATSPSISAAEWTVPGPLQRGLVYTWQVRALVNGKEIVMPPPAAPQARFKVLEAAKLAELARARAAYPTSHLILGIVYARNGLLTESAGEFRSLLAANPGSPVVRKMLQQVSGTVRP